MNENEEIEILTFEDDVKEVRPVLERKKSNRVFRVGIYGGLVFLVLLLVSFIASSFAQVEPVQSVVFTSQNASFENKDAGAWEITESASWQSKGKAQVTVDIETVGFNNIEGNSDLLFLLDASILNDSEKLNAFTNASAEFLQKFLLGTDNRVAIVAFSDTDVVLVSNYTNSISDLVNQFNSFQINSYGTNYYLALRAMVEVLNYSYDVSRDTKVLLVTDGNPTSGSPGDKIVFDFIKKALPQVEINAIQYEMGDKISPFVEAVSDNQFVATKNNITDVIFEAIGLRENYDEFLIQNYLNNEFFDIASIDDIKVDIGQVNLEYENDTPKIIWDLSNDLLSGAKARMTINISLKEVDVEIQERIFPTNKNIVVNSKIGSVEENVLSDLTPIIADNYVVIYDSNLPSGCSFTGNIPDTKYHSVFDTVLISQDKISCSNYKFKGWAIVEDDVKKINDDYFIMPQANVTLRAEWENLSIKKSMDGMIYSEGSLYKTIAQNAVLDNIASEFVSSSNGIDFYSSASDTNGKGVYTLASTADEMFPVHYFRGAVENNNLRFANYCWKIVRTTDSGGVKLIYNGVPDENGGCSATTAEETSIGKSVFNVREGATGLEILISTLAHSGYMYGEEWFDGSRTLDDPLSLLGYDKKWTNIYITSKPVYYYSDTITYDASTGLYTLTDAETLSFSNTLVGKYTCLSTSDVTCTSIKYVVSSNGNQVGYLEFSNGDTYDVVLNSSMKFGKNAVYSDGVYTLTDVYDLKFSGFENGITLIKEQYPYTCFNNSVTCEGINYIYDYMDYDAMYFVLTGGISLDDALYRMTSGSSNEKDSNVKKVIDAFYRDNLVSYSDYIEDTIWCNARSVQYVDNVLGEEAKGFAFPIYDKMLNGKKIDLTCDLNDSFSVSSLYKNGKLIGNARLNYPISLLTADEVFLTDTTYLINGDAFWLLTPLGHMQGLSIHTIVDAQGFNYTLPASDLVYVRPSISLKFGVSAAYGTGTTLDPYVVE